MSRAAVAGCTLLLVDDEEANLDLLEVLLAGEGYTSVVRTSDARQAVPLWERHAPDLVLLDLHMPHLDGFGVLAELRARTPPDDYRPVLVLTADATVEAKERALSSGASDFLGKPIDATEALLRVRNLLETRVLYRELGGELARSAAMAAENARLFAEAQAAVEAQQHTLAVVAHDLRNPICAIRMDAEMLGAVLGAEAAPFARESLERIGRTAVRLDGLIQDLLDVSRIERGRVALELAPHPPAALLARAAEELGSLAAAHGVRLEVDPGEAPPVRADAARVLQIVGNLVGNAVKFTPRGGSVTLACAAEGDDRVRFSVADTGPGIAPEEVPHLFGAFWQAREADRRGLGLGLAIARGLVEAHGGRIWVETAPSRGATFLFTLPRSGSG